MKINVGKADRAVRIVAGVVILSAGYYYGSYWGLVGLVPLLTGFSKRCPVYSIFGTSTCEK
ncbi:MAG: DUF2892 domain-containing protein [Nitrospinae bacterium]|nr:DUF2892 domain-containing protein [Nitrospinota bacterium]